MTDSKDITLSSQPFEPGSTVKRRKVVASSAKTSSSQQPPTFEQELKSLDADMDVDIKSKLTTYLSFCYFSRINTHCI